MTQGARLYLFLLLAAAGIVGGLELPERNFRGFSRRDVARVRRIAHEEMAGIERRVSEGISREEDTSKYALAQRRAEDARREALFRNVQTAAVLLSALASLLFFARTFPAALRRRRSIVSTGIVERLEDEIRIIDDADLPREVSRLLPTKRRALAACAGGPALACGYCGARLRFEAIGRIQRRILKKRPPPGAEDRNVVLAQGWSWHRTDPLPCWRCGANDPR